jgi:hypothetical protein
VVSWPARGSRRWRPGSASDYWRIWFYLLEAAGLQVQLVNAREARNMPGKLKALAAVARSILVIIWHLLADPAAHFRELGSAYRASRTGTQRKARGHIRQLEALGYTVTLTQAA